MFQDIFFAYYLARMYIYGKIKQEIIIIFKSFKSVSETLFSCKYCLYYYIIFKYSVNKLILTKVGPLICMIKKVEKVEEKEKRIK